VINVRYIAVTAILCVAFMACDAQQSQPAPAAQPAAKKAPAAAKTPVPQAQKEVAEPLASEGYATTVFGIKKEPVTDRKIADPAGGDKKISNWVTTIYRGEKLKIIEKLEGKLEITGGVHDRKGYHATGKKIDWLKVEDTSGKTGWIEARYVVSGPDMALATVLATTRSFARPDLLALKEKQEIEPGTLLFTLQQQGDFVEVNFTPTRNIWVQKKDLVQEEQEIMLARMIEKLRYLQRKGKTEELAKLLSLAKDSFKDAKLAGAGLKAFEEGAEKEAK